MAKEKAEDPLKWQAESVVREAIAKTPAFKKAVRQTIKELKQVQKSANKTIRGK